MPPTPVTYCMGLDPGQSGGIAWVDLRTGAAHAVKMPSTERDIWEEIVEGSGRVRGALIEKVSAMPGQGVSSTFKFGQGYGGLRMALVAAEISFQSVAPQTWQKNLGIPRRKKTESKVQFKNRLKAEAQQLYPRLDVTLATADALLIATYCARTIGELNA